MKAAEISLVLIMSFGAITPLMAQEQKEQSDSNSANEYMHRSSIDELTDHFESPERDAYQRPREVLKYLGELKGKKIMDLGAGSGYFSVKLAQKGADVIAADVSEEFQDYLKQRIEKENLKNIELRKLPFDDPMLQGQEVDIVLLVNTYHHIDNRTEYFSKVRNGLKEDGKLVVIDYYKSDIPVGPPAAHKVSFGEVITELKAAGYTNFEVEVNLLPYQFIVRAE